MSVDDWVVEGERDSWGPQLYHRKYGHCEHGRTSRNEDGDWYCFDCNEVAPGEITFAADLCSCKERVDNADSYFYGPFTPYSCIETGIWTWL